MQSIIDQKCTRTVETKKEIKVYKLPYSKAVIQQTKLQRDWLEELPERHGYKCFPMTMANTLGWSISFEEDIEFEWDGITDTSPDHVSVYSGSMASSGRGNATLSIDTGCIFRTDENTSLLSIPVPNYFIDGISPYTNIISTSFYQFSLPIAWRITKPNYRFTIKAGEPVITVIPISLASLINYEVGIYSMQNEEYDQWIDFSKQYGDAISSMGTDFKFSNFYRNAVDHFGNSSGEHEVNSIKLKTVDHSRENTNE